MPPRLTVRQTEVLQLLAKGLGHKEIGAALNISADTVERHVLGIRQACGGGNLVSLLLKFYNIVPKGEK